MLMYSSINNHDLYNTYTYSTMKKSDESALTFQR
jgi:hypothetical protein